MNTYKASRRRGFVLIEALIALLLISVGLLAVSKLQVLSVAGAGEAKARSRAMSVSQQKLEQLRNIILRGDFTGGPLVTPGGSEDVAPIAGDTATYTMAWTVTLDPALEQKVLQIRTTWTDRYNVAQQLDLNSVIAWDDPGERVKTTGSAALPQIISPTGDAIRGTGGYGDSTPPETVTTNPDGTRIHVRADLTTELLAVNGNILLYLPPKNGEAQSFTTISGRVFFDQNAPNNSLPDSNKVKLRLSSEGECIFNNAVASLVAQSNTPNSYKYFAYTCYVGAGWYGNVGVVVDDSVTGAAAGPTVCVGDPQFNGGVSNSTLISAHPIESATRSYRGFKASGTTYVSTGMGAGTRYGTTAGQTGPFDGRPRPSTYPAFYGVIAEGSAGDYFNQNFLVTRLSGPSASCASKMAGPVGSGVFLKNAGKYFCINPDKDPAADVCPDVWPNFQVGIGGSINFTVNVVRDGSGAGSVTEPTLPMNCPMTPCSGSYPSGSTLVFTPVSAGGSAFEGWNGCTSVVGNLCSVIVSGTTTVTATFSAVSGDSLIVTKNGSGSGTVTSGDALINCGTTCSSTYASGARVTLTAAASSGDVFAGWSGGGCSGTGTCTVTVSGATAVTATFTASVTHVLTVIKAGTGSGTVLSSPAGITCGGTCASSYAAGTPVTLTASAAPGSSLTAWSGGSCSGTGTTCTLTVGANTAVTATFATNAPCTTTVSGKVHDNPSTVTTNAVGTCSVQGSTKNYDCGALGLTAPAGSPITLTNQGPGTPPAFSYELIIQSCGNKTGVNFPN